MPSSISSTEPTHGLSVLKSGCSFSVAGALKAMPRKPRSAACLAPASVPECHTALPRFVPRLMPDRTTSTFSHRVVPSITQSPGVPFTRYASMPGSAVRL